MNQGTGLGLSLCKNLCDLMSCDLFLDEEFISGVPGCPGARVVMNLNVPPLHVDSDALDGFESSLKNVHYSSDSEEEKVDISLQVDESTEEVNSQELPETLRVLCVEDDLVLRK